MAAPRFAPFVAAAGGSRISGRQSWRLLWASSKPLSVVVLAWAALDTFDGPLVVASLGYVVGAIPGAIKDGMSSTAGNRLIAALVIAALLTAGGTYAEMYQLQAARFAQ